MMQNYYARRTSNNSIERLQPLEEHLENVSKKAEEKAQALGVIGIAKCAGKWHDIGKYSAAFQKRLVDDGPRTDHSTAGALHAQQQYANKKNFEYYIGRILAYCIAGHHAGLPDGISSESSCLEVRVKKEIEPIPHCPTDILSGTTLTIQAIERFSKSRRDKKHMAFGLSFLTRMIFSCLVDADRLDAEAFDDEEKSKARAMCPTLEDCADHFFKKLDEFIRGAQPTAVNAIRRNVLEKCIEAAKLPAGLFSLTVPTGGGKTLSSLAFALKHALYNDNDRMRRVIYVIPYTSIIEQNAEVFRKFLPENAVIEHHCNFVGKETENDQADRFEMLATDNWDAPVIVTTSVQFFESLFSNSPSQCRKLHNIARSVVIIDEAQNLPRELLLPTIEAIRELSSFYGTSVVLCTATQPAITVNDEFKNGLENVREIIKDPAGLSYSLKRTETSFVGEKTEEEIAALISDSARVLCIVNTKGRARALFESCHSYENVYHLSAAMCPVHRSQKLAEIKNLLSNKDASPCRVISTQLVEAGVDLDFPLVLREIAGLDSIHQAAGRCNREGRLEKGNVLIFQFSDGVPHLFRQQAQITKAAVGDESLSGDIMHFNAITNYFKLLFWMQGRENLDKHSILERIAVGLNDANFPFKEIGELFRLIPDKTMPIFIPYDKTACELLSQLKAGVIGKTLFRKAQQYCVSIYEGDFMRLADARAITPLFEHFYYLENTDLYDNCIGLKMDDPYYRTSESNIV